MLPSQETLRKPSFLNPPKLTEPGPSKFNPFHIFSFPFQLVYQSDSTGEVLSGGSKKSFIIRFSLHWLRTFPLCFPALRKQIVFPPAIICWLFDFGQFYFFIFFIFGWYHAAPFRFLAFVYFFFAFFRRHCPFKFLAHIRHSGELAQLLDIDQVCWVLTFHIFNCSSDRLKLLSELVDKLETVVIFAFQWKTSHHPAFWKSLASLWNLWIWNTKEPREIKSLQIYFLSNTCHPSWTRVPLISSTSSSSNSPFAMYWRARRLWGKDWLYPAHYPKEIWTSPACEGLTVWREEELLGSTAPALPALGHRWVSGLPIVAGWSESNPDLRKWMITTRIHHKGLLRLCWNAFVHCNEKMRNAEKC